MSRVLKNWFDSTTSGPSPSSCQDRRAPSGVFRSGMPSILGTAFPGPERRAPSDGADLARPARQVLHAEALELALGSLERLAACAGSRVRE